ncbi:hypothetical protein ACJRO7_014720 [Eucalyptus globulus]|uniref:Uncharacterized protein n=1 Tax=Eucalyptus globulus TaxID=34317 RepID=A0ABD3L147_EUCGL
MNPIEISIQFGFSVFGFQFFSFFRFFKNHHLREAKISRFLFVSPYWDPEDEFLGYPDAFDAPKLQVWNNAAFDNGESEDSATAAIQASWSSVNPVFVKLSDSLESDDFSKENQSPECADSQISLKSSVPSKIQWKQGTIDAEIEEVENEITSLSSRLEALRLEKAKAEDDKKPQGRDVSAKFKEPKQVVGIGRYSDAAKRIKETLLSSAKPKLNRRGLSLGPAEIASSAGKSRPSIKGEITLSLSIQNWRKSCFWKLEEIDELKVTEERMTDFIGLWFGSVRLIDKNRTNKKISVFRFRLVPDNPTQHSGGGRDKKHFI